MFCSRATCTAAPTRRDAPHAPTALAPPHLHALPPRGRANEPRRARRSPHPRRAVRALSCSPASHSRTLSSGGQGAAERARRLRGACTARARAVDHAPRSRTSSARRDPVLDSLLQCRRCGCSAASSRLRGGAKAARSACACGPRASRSRRPRPPSSSSTSAPPPAPRARARCLPSPRSTGSACQPYGDGPLSAAAAPTSRGASCGLTGRTWRSGGPRDMSGDL